MDQREAGLARSADLVAPPDRPRLDDAGVQAPQSQRSPSWAPDEIERGLAEAPRELAAALVNGRRDLEDRLADGEGGADRQVLLAEVEVDVELVARLGPVLVRVAVADQPRDAGAHHRQLEVPVAARLTAPAVALEPEALDELTPLQELALSERGPADDQLQGPLLRRRSAHPVQSGLELVGGQERGHTTKLATAGRRLADVAAG